MTTQETPISARIQMLIPPLLAVLIVAGLSPLADLIIVSFPFHLGELPWRFQREVQFLSLGPQTAALMALVAALALIAGERMTIWWVALATGVLAVLLTLTLPLFVLDFMQIRHTVQQDGKVSFDRSALKTLVFTLAMIPVLFWTARRGMGAGIKKPKTSRRHEKGEGLIVAQDGRE